MKSKSNKFSVYLIGRGSDVHLRIDDSSVSRIHAELVVTKSGDLFLICFDLCQPSPERGYSDVIFARFVARAQKGRYGDG